MAINVDLVYKTVLLIINKEQRGYLTPDEFNKIGRQVQLEIFIITKLILTIQRCSMVETFQV